MGEVDSAITASDSRQFYDFVRRRKGVRDILERGAQAKCALLHRLCDQFPYLVEFGRVGRTVDFADDVISQASGADKRSQVNGWPGAFEMTEILLQRMPIQIDMVFRGFGTKFLQHAVVRWCNRCAFASDLRSHALSDFAGCAAINQDVELRLALHIDKSRSHDQSGCMNGLFGFRTA